MSVYTGARSHPALLTTGQTPAQVLNDQLEDFQAAYVIVDNFTNQYVWLPDASGSAGRYVSPGQHGAVFPLLPTGRARAQFTAPPGFNEPPVIAGQQCTLLYVDHHFEALPSAGVNDNSNSYSAQTVLQTIGPNDIQNHTLVLPPGTHLLLFTPTLGSTSFNQPSVTGVNSGRSWTVTSAPGPSGSWCVPLIASGFDNEVVIKLAQITDCYAISAVLDATVVGNYYVGQLGNQAVELNTISGSTPKTIFSGGNRWLAVSLFDASANPNPITLGQQAKAASVPVVIASDQGLLGQAIQIAGANHLRAFITTTGAFSAVLAARATRTGITAMNNTNGAAFLGFGEGAAQYVLQPNTVLNLDAAQCSTEILYGYLASNAGGTIGGGLVGSCLQVTEYYA